MKNNFPIQVVTPEKILAVWLAARKYCPLNILSVETCVASNGFTICYYVLCRLFCDKVSTELQLVTLVWIF